MRGLLPRRRGDKRGRAVADEHDRMQFRRMDEGNDADFALLAKVHETAVAALPDLLLDMVAELGADNFYPKTRSRRIALYGRNVCQARRGRRCTT